MTKHRFIHAAAGAAFGFLAMSPAAWAAQQTIQPTDGGQIEFITPSGNIGCIYTPKGGTDVYEPVDGGPELNCSRVEPSYVTVILGPKGPAKLIKDPGEQGCCSDVTKLEYGNSWKEGPFKCESSKQGLACIGTNGHGFSLSKAKVTAN